MYPLRTPLQQAQHDEAIQYLIEQTGLDTYTKPKIKNARLAFNAAYKAYSLGNYHYGEHERFVMSLKHTGGDTNHQQRSIQAVMRQCDSFGFVNGVQGYDGSGIAASIQPNESLTSVFDKMLNGRMEWTNEQILNILLALVSPFATNGKPQIKRFKRILSHLIISVREVGTNIIQTDDYWSGVKTVRERRLLQADLREIPFISVEEVGKGEYRLTIDEPEADLILGKTTPRDYSSTTTYNGAITLPDHIEIEPETIDRVLRHLNKMIEGLDTPESKVKHLTGLRWAFTRAMEIHDYHLPNLYMEKNDDERLYGSGLHLQRIPKDLRNIILEGFWSVDISAAHQSIVWQIVEQGLVPGVEAFVMEQTKYYSQNKSKVRREIANTLMTKHGVPEEVALSLVKTLITAACVYGARANQNGYKDKNGIYQEQSLTKTVMEETRWIEEASKEVAEGFLEIPIIREMRKEMAIVMEGYKRTQPKGTKDNSVTQKSLISKLLIKYERNLLNIMAGHGEMLVALHDGAVFLEKIDRDAIRADILQQIGLEMDIEQEQIGVDEEPAVVEVEPKVVVEQVVQGNQRPPSGRFLTEEEKQKRLDAALVEMGW